MARYCFSPRWLPTLATLLVLPLLISLGVWQLHRAAEKRVLQDYYQARAQAAPIDINHLSTIQKDLQFYSVMMTGHFDNAHTFLLDNKFYQHKVGYQVITPFMVKDNNKVVLINRGWIPQGNDRQQLPEILGVKGEVVLRGIVSVPEKTFTLGHDNNNLIWPKRVEDINLLVMAKMLQQPVYPFVVLLSTDSPYGFSREWQPFNGKIASHYGYAFQWFALAITLLIIFLAVNTHKR